MFRKIGDGVTTPKPVDVDVDEPTEEATDPSDPTEEVTEPRGSRLPGDQEPRKPRT